MKNNIFESELKVLEILWEEDGILSVRDLAKRLNESTGWQTTTSYTVIKTCTKKGLLERFGTKKHYMCRVLITRKEAQIQEVEILTDKMFSGSSELLVAALLGNGNMNSDQVKKLRKLVQEFF